MRFKIPVVDCYLVHKFGEFRSYPFAPHRLQEHEGVDFAPAWEDERTDIEVYAAQSGTVQEVAFDAKGYGHYVKIKHNVQYSTYYAHLKKKPLLKVGDPISIGDLVGIMGSTGNSTGRHLHFTLQDNVAGLNNYVIPKVIDPEPLLVSNIATCVLPFSVYNYINDYMTR